MNYKLIAIILKLIALLYTMRKSLKYRKIGKALERIGSRFVASKGFLYLNVFIKYVVLPLIFFWFILLGLASSFMLFAKTNNILIATAVMCGFVGGGIFHTRMALKMMLKAKIQLRLSIVGEQ